MEEQDEVLGRRSGLLLLPTALLLALSSPAVVAVDDEAASEQSSTKLPSIWRPILVPTTESGVICLLCSVVTPP